jgi:hypothetical protein
MRAGGGVLQPVLRPARRHAELPGLESYEHDVREPDDLIPNEPPESGAVISRSLDPGSPSAAATGWSVNAPWKCAQAVTESPRQSAITP